MGLHTMKGIPQAYRLIFRMRLIAMRLFAYACLARALPRDALDTTTQQAMAGHSSGDVRVRTRHKSNTVA